MKCTYCPAPTADGIHLCKHCQTDLYETIREIPELIQDLSDTTAKLNNHGGNGGAPGFNPAAPADLNALETGYHLRLIVNSWASMLRDYDRRKHHAVPRNVHDYLAIGIPEIRKHDWAGDTLRELNAATRKARKLLDAPKEVRILGPCRKRLGLPERCNTPLKTSGDNPKIICPNCGTEYLVKNIEEWNRQRARGKPMTGPEAKRWLQKHARVNIPYNTVRTWVNRGQVPYVLKTVNTTDRAVKLVYPGDVLQRQYAG